MISGYDIVAVLDAAHKRGKSYNRAEDGYILRKDLHALYDADLLTIADDGLVALDESIQMQYGQFDHIRIPTT